MQKHLETDTNQGWTLKEFCTTPSTPHVNHTVTYITLSGTPSLQYMAEFYSYNKSLKLEQIEKFTIKGKDRKIFIFNSPPDTTSRQLEITVTSSDQDLTAYLKVSEYCEEVEKVGIYDKSRPSVMLTFLEKGRITLSTDKDSSLKAKGNTTYFIGIFLNKTSENSKTAKSVTLVLKQSFNYEYTEPLCFLIFLSFSIGVVVTIWALVCFRVPPTLGGESSVESTSTISGTVTNSETNKSTMQTIRNLFFPCVCPCNDSHDDNDELKPLIPKRRDNEDYSVIRCSELCDAMCKVVKLHWLGQGLKAFSNITCIVGFVLMVGAFQFVYENWSVMIQSGDRDHCYYNEFCYRVSGADIPFNLMISNLVYMIHGLLLGWSVWIREAELYAKAKKFANITVNRHGARGLDHADTPGRERVPKHFLQCQHVHHHLPELQVPSFEASDDEVCELYALAYKRKYSFSIGYAFAWALIFEGFFSLIYHFCPTRLTFQFDSAFMFVISGLIVMSLYNGAEINNKCCSSSLVKAVPASNFFLLVIVPLFMFNYLGSLYNLQKLNIVVEVIFFIALTIWYLYLFCWAVLKVFSLQIATRDYHGLLNCKGVTKILCFISTVVFTAVVFPYVYDNDMSSLFLFSCILASLLSIFGKVIIHANDKLFLDQCSFKRVMFRLFQVLYVLSTMTVMLAAIWVFQAKATTDKTLSPAESRNLNRECVFFDFFDHHDIWHILSSFGLLMGAYLVMYISD